MCKNFKEYFANKPEAEILKVHNFGVLKICIKIQ